MTTTPLKVLFLFSGATNRRKILDEVAEGKNADTALRGMNHIPGAEFLDVEEAVRAILPAWIYHLVPWQMRSMLLYRQVRRYDVVVAQDDLPLGYLASKTTRIRWIYIAVNSSILMRRHVRHPLRLAFLKAFWKSFFRIACLSTEQLEDFARAGIPRERLAFVPFGIDADFFTTIDATRKEEFIMSVGRDLGRDYATLLETAERSNHPFLIIAAHKNLPEGTSLPPNVSVRYNLPLAEVRDLYARARLVVIASKDADVPEGSDCSGQTAILDALAAGKSVIATRRPWMADYFTFGEELVAVEPYDATALATEIERLWNAPQERSRLAQAGRAKVRETYTTRALARALEHIASS
ncbi:MAG TPA: glycosyltransferase family 4 protein [Candidatus Paceibacterota bacterium]|nr:glycosyltransferase family 4 protein [Candidatus Paceibacterota bacterium]